MRFFPYLILLTKSIYVTQVACSYYLEDIPLMEDSFPLDTMENSSFLALNPEEVTSLENEALVESFLAERRPKRRLPQQENPLKKFRHAKDEDEMQN